MIYAIKLYFSFHSLHFAYSIRQTVWKYTWFPRIFQPNYHKIFDRRFRTNAETTRRSCKYHNRNNIRIRLISNRFNRHVIAQTDPPVAHFCNAKLLPMVLHVFRRHFSIVSKPELVRTRVQLDSRHLPDQIPDIRVWYTRRNISRVREIDTVSSIHRPGTFLDVNQNFANRFLSSSIAV